MKFKVISIKLFLSISLIILQGFSLNAQDRKGKGDKTKAFLNFTFEVFEDESTISEPMQITLLKNVGSPTTIGADIFNKNSLLNSLQKNLDIFILETIIFRF